MKPFRNKLLEALDMSSLHPQYGQARELVHRLGLVWGFLYDREVIYYMDDLYNIFKSTICTEILCAINEESFSEEVDINNMVSSIMNHWAAQMEG